MYCFADFSSVLDRVTRWFPKGVLKQGFWCIQVITFFWTITSEIHKLWRWFFFFISSKFVVDFKKALKLPENVEGFADHCVWTCCGRFFQLWQEYMWSFVNVVKSCPKISDPIKGDDTQLNLFDINGTLA